MGVFRSRIHERTISLRFLGLILRVLRLEVFVYNVYITNQFQPTFAHRGLGAKSISRGDCEYEAKLLKLLSPITSKNSVSGRMYRNSVKHSGMRIEFMHGEGSIGVDYWYNARGELS